MAQFSGEPLPMLSNQEDKFSLKEWQSCQLPFSAFFTPKEAEILNQLAEVFPQPWLSQKAVYLYGGALTTKLMIPENTAVLSLGEHPRPFKATDIDIAIEALRVAKDVPLSNLTPYLQEKMPDNLEIYGFGNKLIILPKANRWGKRGLPRPIDVTRFDFGRYPPNYLRAIRGEIDFGEQKIRVWVPPEVKNSSDLFRIPNPEVVFAARRSPGEILRAGLKALADPRRFALEPPPQTLQELKKKAKPRAERANSLDWPTLYTFFSLWASIPDRAHQEAFVKEVVSSLGLDPELVKSSYDLYEHPYLDSIFSQEPLIIKQGVNRGVWLPRFTQEDAVECLRALR